VSNDYIQYDGSMLTKSETIEVSHKMNAHDEIDILDKEILKNNHSLSKQLLETERDILDGSRNK
jgi:hypothetical protein